MDYQFRFFFLFLKLILKSILKKLIFFILNHLFRNLQDICKILKLNSKLKKLKTQTQTQTFEYFWVQMSGHRKMQEMLTVCSNVNTDPIKYASAKLITVPTKKT